MVIEYIFGIFKYLIVASGCYIGGCYTVGRYGLNLRGQAMKHPSLALQIIIDFPTVRYQ